MQTLLLVFTSLFQSLAASLSEYEGDATVLVQLGQALADAPTYAFDRYSVGDQIEGKARDGSWMPVLVKGINPDKTYNVHILEEYPGYDLQGVPSPLLRRSLQDGNMSDWLVDNSRLQHKGDGVFYRHAKDLHNRSTEYAPWGALVVGRDEGDGWVKVSAGYLPVQINGQRILLQRERRGQVSKVHKEFVRLYRAEEERRKQQVEAQLRQTTTPPPQTFQVGEVFRFKTRKGVAMQGKISALGRKPHTYDAVVGRNENEKIVVKDLAASRLVKVPVHVPVPGESPMCQRDGCIMVYYVHEDGYSRALHLSKRMRVEMLLKMVCNGLKMQWEQCQQNLIVSHSGKRLPSMTKIGDTGLQDSDTVDLQLQTATGLKAIVSTHRATQVNVTKANVSTQSSAPSNITKVSANASGSSAGASAQREVVVAAAVRNTTAQHVPASRAKANANSHRAAAGASTKVQSVPARRTEANVSAHVGAQGNITQAKKTPKGAAHKHHKSVANTKWAQRAHQDAAKARKTQEEAKRTGQESPKAKEANVSAHEEAHGNITQVKTTPKGAAHKHHKSVAKTKWAQRAHQEAAKARKTQEEANKTGQESPKAKEAAAPPGQGAAGKA